MYGMLSNGELIGFMVAFIILLYAAKKFFNLVCCIVNSLSKSGGD